MWHTELGSKGQQRENISLFYLPYKVFGGKENFLHSDAPTGICVLLSLMHTAGWINFPNHIALCSTDMWYIDADMIWCKSTLVTIRTSGFHVKHQKGLTSIVYLEMK